MKALILSILISLSLATSSAMAGGYHRDHDRNNHNDRHYSSQYKHDRNKHYGRHHHSHKGKNKVVYVSSYKPRHRDNVAALVITGGILGFILANAH